MPARGVRRKTNEAASCEPPASGDSPIFRWGIPSASGRVRGRIGGEGGSSNEGGNADEVAASGRGGRVGASPRRMRGRNEPAAATSPSPLLLLLRRCAPAAAATSAAAARAASTSAGTPGARTGAAGRAAASRPAPALSDAHRASAAARRRRGPVSRPPGPSGDGAEAPSRPQVRPTSNRRGSLDTTSIATCTRR